MGKNLVSYVHVAGRVFGPADDVPADIAKLITNPKAWGESPATSSDKAPKPDKAPKAEVAADESLTGDYDAAKVPALKAEIARRNEDRDEEDLIPTEGNKAVLVAALEADDEAAEDDESDDTADSGA